MHRRSFPVLVVLAVSGMACTEGSAELPDVGACLEIGTVPGALGGPLGTEAGPAVVETSSSGGRLRFDSGEVYEMADFVRPIPSGSRVYAEVTLAEGPIVGVGRPIDVVFSIWTLDGGGPGELARAFWRGTRLPNLVSSSVSYRGVRASPAEKECGFDRFRLALEVETPGEALLVPQGCQVDVGPYRVSNLIFYEFDGPVRSVCSDTFPSYAHGAIVDEALLSGPP